MSSVEERLYKGQNLPLQRAVNVISVPFGKVVELPEDAEVQVMQARGNSVSVGYEGRLYLIEGDQLDAIGLEPVAAATLPEGASDAELEQFAWDCLRTCFDPEIPVNIVELGLVYSVRVESLISGEKMITVRMTLTAPGCGMGDVIAADAKHKIMGAAQVSKVHVEIVFNPPWSREMMSDEAKLELGMF
ncbi:putative Fe-S cluster assembly protein SufT [Carnimonas bestiolae]|uniref:putative Fe-S cluster assembly protein SufT n=1 Tax=Carnimonas bestiolae TaxID=3402172 RepID=UPI003EDBAC64